MLSCTTSVLWKQKTQRTAQHEWRGRHLSPNTN